MNAYEHFALSEYLSGFPDDLSYDEVMDLLRNGDDEVLVWEAFEHTPRKDLAFYIDNLRERLEFLFIPREEKDNV